MSNWTPSIVPKGDNENVYLVLGRCWHETNIETTDLETVIADLQDGRYANPVRIVSFSAVEGWSRDVSRDIAHELRRRSDLQRRELPAGVEDFVRRFATGDREQLTLRFE